MSTQNICFCAEIRKNKYFSVEKSALSRAIHVFCKLRYVFLQRTVGFLYRMPHLTLCMLGKKISRQQFEIFFLFFPRKLELTFNAVCVLR